MAVFTEPGYAVLSGPLVRRNDCQRALEASGFTVLEPEPLPDDPSQREPHRGLPAYRNPTEAHQAGKPNSGHTPGTPHPEPPHGIAEHVGEEYEDDPRIAFLDVQLPERGENPVDEIHRIAQGARFTLRLHTATQLVSKRQPEPELTVEQRLEIAEAHLASIRMERLRASGVPLNAITSPPYALQQGSHGAQLFREATSSLISPAGGIVQPQDFTLTQNSTPNMSVNIGAGRIWVPSTYLATVNPGGGAYYPAGLYFAESDATVNLAISASNATNPRLDQGIVQVQDAAYAGAVNSAQLAILTGTPTAGASLTNLVGLASMPASSMLLGYSLCPANATTIVTVDLAQAVNPATLAGIGGPTVRGMTPITTTGTRTNTAYGFLNDANDQVAGVVLPTNGLIVVWYQATWQESVLNAGAAAIFLGANQVQAAGPNGPLNTVSGVNNTAGAAHATPLSTYGGGLASSSTGTYTADVTTGQIVGINQGTGVSGDVGPCYIFAAAGTYTVSVQFKASSGSVTASNRKLWVQVLPFS